MRLRSPVWLLILLLGSGPSWAQQPEYVVRGEDPDALVKDAPELPSLERYSGAAIKAKIGAREPGSVQVERMVNLRPLDEFTGSDGRLALWARRQTRNPRAIVIRGGYVTPADIAAALRSAAFEETSPREFIARLPILVMQGATLHIDKATKHLRLSTEAGAFIVNDGRLFITGSTVSGWREDGWTTAINGNSDGEQFRPFLLSWGDTDTYIANSRFVSLGYSESKSYGLTISQYPPAQQERLQRKSPAGWIIDSTFEDMWFGFYCYEADDLVIARNTYQNSIVYGIDPHDRSHRLIIAENTVFGTKKKHGIIISREVSHSWLFGNRSYENALSGMVIDRKSSHNVIAKNELIDNGSDGLTIYESPDNLLWANKSAGNSSHGFRVRNSVGIELYDNVAIGNAYAGINGHAKVLAPEDRNLQLDPYNTDFSMVIVGGRLVHNGGGPIDIEKPLSIEMAHVEMLAPANETGVELEGVLGEHLHEVLDLMVRQKKAVIIEVNNVRRKVEG